MYCVRNLAYVSGCLTVAPFMGMDNQLSQLKGMISGATQAYKGVVLIGPQGCGKAALANALARSTKGR